MKAIFMVGEQRSGSNLLRVILNQSDKIAAPHPPHILQRLMPLMSFYGGFNNEEQFMSLISDVCQLVESNPVTWEGMQLDRQAVRDRCREVSLVAVYGAIMDIYAESQNASSWLCKSMQNIRWADQLDEYFDEPKYLYLYRDPRDVCLSFSKAVIGEKHPYFIAKQWTELQKLCLAHRERAGAGRFFSLCYEDLINEPRRNVERLCEFLDIEFNENMLAFHTSGEANRTAMSSDLWANLSRPIMNTNRNKYIDHMCDDDIYIVESVAGRVMDILGYERTQVEAGEEVRFSPTTIDFYRQINEARKNERKKTASPEDIVRRRRQEQVLDRIQQRQ